jgi:hypothetical protein
LQETQRQVTEKKTAIFFFDKSVVAKIIPKMNINGKMKERKALPTSLS